MSTGVQTIGTGVHAISVVKLGGELLDAAHAEELRAIAADTRVLLDAGRRLVFVHGGGPQTTALQKQLGQEVKIVGGRRITDAAALDVLKMVVGGKLNIDLCSALRAAGVDALGLNGVSGGAISCVRRPPKAVTGGGDQPVDFGFVGDVTGVNSALLARLLEHGLTPVLACIGSDSTGAAYNINADMVASQLAAKLAADRLVMITGTSGVLKDIEDRGSRIPRLTIAEARAAIAAGSVKGGMIAKLEEAIDAIEGGVPEVQVVGQLRAGDLGRAFAEAGSVGTLLVR
jgi:acetylglutamate kinase